MHSDACANAIASEFYVNVYKDESTRFRTSSPQIPDGLTAYSCVCYVLLSLLMIYPDCGRHSIYRDLCSVDADDEEDQELQQALWLSSQQAQPHDADPQGFDSGGNAEPGVVLPVFLEGLNKIVREGGRECGRAGASGVGDCGGGGGG